MDENRKKELLVVSMLNDQTTDKDSNRYIQNAEKTIAKIQNSLSEGKVRHDAIVLVDYHGSTNSKWNNIANIRDSLVVNFEVRTDDWISVDNIIRVKNLNGGVKEINAVDFDFIFPPDKYNLTFCGIDLFGAMSTAMTKLSKAGYITRVYTDASHIYGNNLNTTLRAANVFKRVVDYKGNKNVGKHRG